MSTPPAQPPLSGSGYWRNYILTVAFLVIGSYSAYLAVKLLTASCEGFSCTYLGMAWVFWAGVLCLPTVGLGYFAQRSKAISRMARLFLRAVLLVHIAFSIGLLAWWGIRHG